MEILILGKKIKLSKKISDCIQFHHHIGQPIIIIGGSIRECLINKPSDGHIDILLEGDNNEVIRKYKQTLNDKKFEYMHGISPSFSFSIDQTRIEVIGLMDKDGQLRNIEGKKMDLARQKIIHLTIERMGITDSLEIFDPYHGFEDFQQGILRAIGHDFKQRLSFQKILKFLTVKNQFGFDFETELGQNIKNFFLEPRSYQWGQRLINVIKYYHNHPKEMVALKQLHYHRNGVYQEEYNPNDKFKIGLHLLLFLKRSPNSKKAIEELIQLGGHFLEDILEVCGIELHALAQKVRSMDN